MITSFASSLLMKYLIFVETDTQLICHSRIHGSLQADFNLMARYYKAFHASDMNINSALSTAPGSDFHH